MLGQREMAGATPPNPSSPPPPPPLKVTGGGAGAAAEPVEGSGCPPQTLPVLTGPPLLGAYMPRGSGGAARPTGGSFFSQPFPSPPQPPGVGWRLEGLEVRGGDLSSYRRRSRLVLGGGGGGGGSAAAAGGRDGSGGRRERERSGCARGGGGTRWQQVSR